MKLRYLLFLTVLLFGVGFASAAVFAQEINPPTGNPPTGNPSTDNPKTGTSAGTVRLDNPLPTDDVPTLIGQIIKGMLGIVGSLALVMFIYGGFTWMLAGGNTESVTKGRNIILWAAIGLVVIFTSYALVNFVITAITSH